MGLNSKLPTEFWVGNFEFNPKQIGYQSEKFTGGFHFDTQVTGNSNRGHEFRAGCREDGVIGRALQPEERWALIEYLKVLGNPALEQQLQPVAAKTWTPGPSCQN